MGAVNVVSRDALGFSMKGERKEGSTLSTGPSGYFLKWRFSSTVKLMSKFRDEAECS